MTEQKLMLLSDGLSSTCTTISDVTSLFSFVHDKYISRDELTSISKTGDLML